MLAPFMRMVLAKRAKSSASFASSGTYTALTLRCANPALCIAGDSECITGFPTTP